MNSQPLTHRLPSRKTGAFLVRAAFIASLLFAAAIPSLKAQTAVQTGSCQTLIENYLSAHSEGTILSATSPALANAVAMAIKSNTNTTLLPQYFAQAALLPYPYGTNGSTGSVRSDRNTSAVLVTGSAIAQVIATGTTATISAGNIENRIAAIADSVVDVSGTNTAKNLTAAARTAVVEKALTTVTNSYAQASTAFKATLLASDQALGTVLLDDSYLESLPSDGLTTILQAAMPGVTGTNPALAPTAAQSFVTGLVTTSSNTFTWPDKGQGATAGNFTTDILKDAAGNGTLDALVSNTVAVRVYNNNPSNLAAVENIANDVLGFFGTANVKTAVVEGVIAGVTKGDNVETERAALVQNLGTYHSAAFTSVEDGAIFVDPYYAATFTTALFTGIKATVSGTTLLRTDAPTIATDAGTELGADGNVLTEVASSFATYIGNNLLSATAAGTYASNMIKGAQTSTVAPFALEPWGNGGGGKLNLTQGSITSATVADLASITDVLAGGIRTYFQGQGTINTTGASAFGADVGALAEAVAKTITTETFNGSTNTNHSGLVAEYIAATLADYIVALQIGGGSDAAGTPENYALADIKTDVDAAVNNTNDNTAINNAVDGAVNHSNGYGDITGPLAAEETTVTNL